MNTDAMDKGKLRLQGWGERLTCFTAALGTWLTDRCYPWWEPLLAGGPTLIVSRRGDCWLFEHAPHPWMPSLGLEFTGSDRWDRVSVALREEIEHAGSVIIAADVYRLPWHRGHQRWHAPHWLVVRGEAELAYVEDPLDMTTPEGVQSSQLVCFPWDELREIARALDPVSKIFELREQSIAGPMDIALASSYRWLRSAARIGGKLREPCVTPMAPYGSLRGPDACRALADFYDAAGDDDRAYTQADDLWQAVRQRELAAAAAALEPMPLGIAAKVHWEAAVTEWRRVPPLLLHARLRAKSGASDPAKHLSAALRRAAEYEGHWSFERRGPFEAQLSTAAEQFGTPAPQLGLGREAEIHA